MPETIIDLGRKVKTKYPQYADMDDAELGRRIKVKYPGAYDDFTDVQAQPKGDPAVLAAQAARYPTSAEQGGPSGAPIQKSRLEGFSEEGIKNTGKLFNAMTDTAPGAETGMDQLSYTMMTASQPSQFFKGVPSAIEQFAAPGAKVAQAGEALRNAPVVKPFADLVQRAKVALAGGPERHVEQLIGPSGAERQALTQRISPELAKDEQLVKMAKRAMADRYSYDKFKAAEHALEAAERSVPRGTTIAKQPILDELDAAIERLRVPAEQMVSTPNPVYGTPELGISPTGGSISGHPDALHALGEARNAIAKFPDQIPFENLRKYRQQLDKAVQTHSGWKETGNAADQAAMQAKRSVVNVIRGKLSGISPEMDAANKAYSQAADTVTASGLDWETGRRLAKTGKPSEAQELAQRAKKYLGRGIIAGAGVETIRRNLQ